jgi:hypothetical protein
VNRAVSSELLSSAEKGERAVDAASVPARAVVGAGLVGWRVRGFVAGAAGSGCVALWSVEQAIEQLWLSACDLLWRVERDQLGELAAGAFVF